MSYRTCSASLFTLFMCPVLVLGAEIRGIVSHFDANKKELVVAARGIGIRGTLYTFSLADNVQISNGQLSNLAPGQRVRLTYEQRDGKLVVTFVNIGGLLGNLLKAIPELPIAPEPRPTPLPGAQAADPKPGNAISGPLRRVAYTEREIIVARAAEDGGESYTVLKVPEDARIFRDGKPVPFDDLKEEEQAVVHAELRAGQQVATTVEIGERAAIPVQEPNPASTSSTSRITQLRMLLRMADRLLEELEKR